MAHAIPKLEYKNVELVGELTSGVDVVTSLPSTEGIEVGMLVEGAGIPEGATVLDISLTTVQISEAATTTGPVDVAFLYRIEFDYPPIEQNDEALRPDAAQSISLSGKIQTSVMHIEGRRKLRFSHLPTSLYAALYQFFLEHGFIGREFRYFDDKLSSDFIVYELADLKWQARKIAPRGSGYVWEVPLEIRRVVS